MKQIKKPPGKPDDLFWKLLALIGTIASVASLIKALID
jgi:hypothetical protein